MGYRILNIAAGLEIGICLLLSVFLLLVMLGNFTSPSFPADVVLNLNLHLDQQKTLPAIPTNVLYDIQSSNCQIGRLAAFYYCGIRTECSGIDTTTFLEKSVKIPAVPECTFTGFVRFQFGDKKIESVYK